MQRNVQTEAVECCPYCLGENVYPDKDCSVDGYIENCRHCGQQIFLCDECRCAADNRRQECDWHTEEHHGMEFGVCFRGIVPHGYAVERGGKANAGKGVSACPTTP